MRRSLQPLNRSNGSGLHPHGSRPLTCRSRGISPGRPSRRQGIELGGVTVFRYDEAGHFRDRIEAKSAMLEAGYWRLEAARLQVSRQIAERRVALLSGRGSVAEEAAAMLAQRKRATAASVIVLESLSQALPDDTYVTQLQLANGDVQISGITREAASLIRIIEQTDQFKHATFFAPTTRAPVGDGEQFHIEARVTPYFPAVQ